MIEDGARGYVTAAAVNLVMSAREDRDTRAAVLGASLAVPDGQPLVWALHALGHNRATRVYGPDLMAHFCARAARAGTPMFLYGGRTEEALELLERRLRERFPGVQLVGGYSPPFRPLSVEEEREVIAAIDASGAHVVWVGTGQPKQEKWMHQMRPRLSAPLLVGVGAAFDFHAGLVSQAPAWMQRNGLEWLYRLCASRGAWWRRYARYNPLFVVCFLRQYLRHRIARAQPEPGRGERADRRERGAANLLRLDDLFAEHRRRRGCRPWPRRGCRSRCRLPTAI